MLPFCYLIPTFLGGLNGIEFACSAGDPGEGNGTSLQYSCLENPMDGGAW